MKIYNSKSYYISSSDGNYYKINNKILESTLNDAEPGSFLKIETWKYKNTNDVEIINVFKKI